MESSVKACPTFAGLAYQEYFQICNQRSVQKKKPNAADCSQSISGRSEL